MKNRGKKEIKKILFYTGIPRNFRTTLIGYLYEIAQVYPVILLSEKLDDDLKKIVNNKKLFPKLEKVITVNQYTGPKRNLFRKNRHLYKTAKEVIHSYKPDVVMAPHDIYPFEMYLMRFAKKIDAITLAIQEGNVEDIESRRKNADLINAYSRFPEFLPLFIRSFLVRCRKYAGHILYYWILPVSVGEEPFFGKSSYILRKGISGMRDTDYRIVFSKRDCDIHIKAGVPSERLYILSHPLERNTKNFFKKVLLSKDNHKITQKAATLLIPADEIGIRKKDHSLISKERRLKTRMEIVSLVSKALKGWKIYIKPHPNVKGFDEIKNAFESISDLVKVVDPSESSDKYIKISNAIVGLPKSASTVLLSASLLFPEKAILSLDFDKELTGDFYKDFKGIEYVDSEDGFIQTLDLIKNNKFHKKVRLEKENSQAKEFSNFVDLLDFLTSLSLVKNS